MPTVTTSIGEGVTHDHDAAISAVSGTGPYTVTIAANTSVNGDALWDEHATPRKYLITAGGGTTSLTVEDVEAVGSAPDNSGTSLSAITRYYNGATPLVDWEADLSGAAGGAGNDANGECYNDAGISDNIVVNDNTPDSITVGAASGEEHDGTGGTGVLLTAPSSEAIEANSALTVAFRVNNMDVKGGASTGSALINSLAKDATYRRCIFREFLGYTAESAMVLLNTSTAPSEERIVDCILYNAFSDNDTVGGSRSLFGIRGALWGGSRNVTINNCTIHDITMDGDGGHASIGIHGNSYAPVKNCLVTQVDGASSGGHACLSSLGSSTTNATSDATGDVVSITTADQYVSTVLGSEDLHLKAGSDAIAAGTDLGTGIQVNIDINQWDRDATGEVWDIGAHQFETTTITQSIGEGVTHDTNVDITAAVATERSLAYTVTLASTPGDLVAGDALWDEHATPRKYLVLFVNSTTVTVRDSEGTGSAPDFSATTQAEIKRYYNGSSALTSWEVDLGDTNVHPASTPAIGECYSDASFDQALAVEEVGSPPSSITLTVASGERHDGTEGTGVRMVAGAVSRLFAFYTDTTFKWFELDANGRSVATLLLNGKGTSSKLLMHGQVDSGNDIMYRTTGGTARLLNSVLYSCHLSGSGNATAIREEHGDSQSNKYQNLTIHDFTTADGNSKGITFANGAGRSLQNVLMTDITASGTGTGTCFTGSPATEEYNASSDATASGTGSLTSITTADQYVSTVGGSEDLHIKAGSDAIQAGTILGTASNVHLDIDGTDRADRGYIWDIGAHQYLVRTITTTIGGGTSHNENVDISASSGSSGLYLVTVAASHGGVVGDALWDEHATPRKYFLLAAVSSTQFYVWDTESVGSAPDLAGGSQAVITRFYEGSTPLADWEASLDDTELYASGEAAIGLVYNDAVITAGVTINGGGTVGLTGQTLSVASGERHDGTAGTGAVSTASISPSRDGTTIEWMEVDANGAAIQKIINVAAGDCNLYNNLVHDTDRASGSEAYGIWASVGSIDTNFLNNVIYDIEISQSASGTSSGGIVIRSETGIDKTLNNTIYNVITNGTGSANGIWQKDGSNNTVQNNISMDCISELGSEKDFYWQSAGGGGTFSYCLSSDTTAAGTGSLTTNSSSNIFVSTVAGSEDLHLKEGAAAIDTGVDLVATPTGVNIDINGRDRDTEEDVWDMGAHEFVLEVLQDLHVREAGWGIVYDCAQWVTDKGRRKRLAAN